MDAKRKRIVAVGGVVALAAIALALDQVLSLGFFGEESAEVQPLTGNSPAAEPGVAPAPGAEAVPKVVAANGAKPEAGDGEDVEGESEDEEEEEEGEEGEEGEEEGGEAGKKEVGLSPAVPAGGPEAGERTHTALATIATWEPKAGSYPEGALLGYLTHKKMWVSATALAFAVETGAYSETFLRARGSDIRTRFPGPRTTRFLRRFQEAKPDVYSKLLVLVAPAASDETPVK